MGIAEKTISIFYKMDECEQDSHLEGFCKLFRNHQALVKFRPLFLTTLPSHFRGQKSKFKISTI